MTFHIRARCVCWSARLRKSMGRRPRAAVARPAGDGAGDGQDLTDLVHGAGLEGDVGEALGVEALEQGGGLLELGDPGGDGD
ncbi:MAG: hypothetical protein ACFNLW_00730, partial [Olsenella sp.]